MNRRVLLIAIAIPLLVVGVGVMFLLSPDQPSPTASDASVEAIDVAPGSRGIAVRFREVRLDAAIDVVHRHGVGSCRGRLVATPRGLRYETANRDDMFTTGLLDLDTFQIDYLERNLRVRVANGEPPAE